MKLRTIRILFQTLFCLLFFLHFFALNRHPVAYRFNSEEFLELNPFPGFLATLASKSLAWGHWLPWLLIALATLALGRFFCGMVCPLGALIDFSDRFLFRKTRDPKRRPPVFLQRLKYVLLIAVSMVALFGVYVPLFTDPISLLTRFSAILAWPLSVIIGSDALAYLQPVLAKMGAESLAYATVKVPLFYGSALVLLLVLVVFAGGFWDKRFWCQYVCPSGAFFALLGRFSMFRRKIDLQACNNCKGCERSCPTRAIDEKDITRTSTAECILCGACVDRKSPCGAFAFKLPASTEVAGPDVHRRHALAGVLAGLALVPLYRTNAVARRDNSGRLIRPPGAIPEPEFAARCLACGECMKACPTNAIQPCMPTDGFHRLFTPKIVPRIGGCEEKCYLCGHVCPTGAIRALTYEEKRFGKIGTAVVDRHRCLAWEQNKECMVCDEVCPHNAVTVTLAQTTTGPFRVPLVDESLCLGCGLCEQHCPIDDEAAIVVFKFGENRLATGEYASKSQKKAILEKRRKSDESIGSSFGGSEKTKPGEEKKEPRALPEGFTFD